MPLAFSAASRRHVLADVAATRGGATVDPTSDTVRAAFLAVPPESASPVEEDWVQASWETNPTTDPDQFSVMCLVGPSGAIELDPGTYYMWVEITDLPELIVEYSGVIRITP